MRHIDLNHARPMSSDMWLQRVLLGLGCVAAIGIVLALNEVDMRTRMLEDDVSRLQNPQAGSRRVSQAEVLAKTGEIAAVRAVAEELALPWEALFQTLERSDRPEVKLLTLEPDVKRRKIRLTAETQDADEMLGYIETLTKQPMLRDVFVTSHERTHDDVANIRFVVEANWVNQS